MPSLTDMTLASITVATLEQLVLDQQEETRTLEFKRDLPGRDRDSRLSFLKTVCAYANTIGGDLIYGIDAPRGIAEALPGVEVPDLDELKRTLGQLVQTSIDPRVFDVDIQPVALERQRCCIIVRVARSFGAPHVVEYQGHWRFYGRDSASSYPLDHGQVRSAFSTSLQGASTIRSFRMGRLQQIGAGQGPVELEGPAYFVLHLIPLGSMELGASVDVEWIGRTRQAIDPVGGYLSNQRFNIDGFIGYDRCRVGVQVGSYVQTFRSGVDRTVRSTPDHEEPPPFSRRILSIPYFEAEIHAKLPTYLKVLESIGVRPPVAAMISILGAKGAFATSGINAPSREEFTFDRDLIVGSETLINQFGVPVDRVLKPLIDPIWQAAGYAESVSFKQGQFQPNNW